jgi:hypothetical protein
VPTPRPYDQQVSAEEINEFVMERGNKMSSTYATELLDSHAQEFTDENLLIFKDM